MSTTGEVIEDSAFVVQTDSVSGDVSIADHGA